MKIALILFVSIIFSSCSHMFPLQMGTGENSNKQVKACTHSLLFFPLNAQQNTIRNMFDRYKVTPKDVYTIETSYWYYLWPLYTNKCTIINLNKNYGGMMATPTNKRNKKSKSITDIEECGNLKGRLSRRACIRELR